MKTRTEIKPLDPQPVQQDRGWWLWKPTPDSLGVTWWGERPSLILEYFPKPGDRVKSVRVCPARSVTEEEAEAAGYHATYWPAYVANGEICGPDGEEAVDAMASELKLKPESWVSVVTYEDQGAAQ